MEAIEMGQKFQRGEESGFTFFFNLLWEPLYLYAYKILKDHDITEDVVELAFIRVWAKHERISHPKVIRSYLYTSVRNECFRYFGKEKYFIRENGALSYWSEPDFESSIDEKIVKAETVAGIHKYIQSLPEECRNIFKLLYIEGLTMSQVAAELAMKYNTVKSQHHRGLGLLRSCFKTKSVYLRSRDILDEKKVLEIYYSTKKQVELMKIYGVSKSCISAIKRGDSRADITGHRSFS